MIITIIIIIIIITITITIILIIILIIIIKCNLSQQNVNDAMNEKKMLFGQLRVDMYILNLCKLQITFYYNHLQMQNSADLANITLSICNNFGKSS